MAIDGGDHKAAVGPGWFVAAVLGMGMHSALAASHAEHSAYWTTVAGRQSQASGKTRMYYIAADEVTWDYAPLGSDAITGKPFDGKAITYASTGPGRIGSRYLKCLYRAYTDGTFTRIEPRAADDAYLGFLGPVIRAEVGDTIKVLLRNNCRIAVSLHPHGVFYTKANEGAPYADGTKDSDKLDDSVGPGAIRTYTWSVPERAGPGPHDGSSVMWMYHSHVHEDQDLYAGLVGPMVVTARGMARADGSPKDVDREVFELFTIDDENESPYWEVNAARLGADQAGLENEAEFLESNRKHSINGYIYGNQPLVTMRQGAHVRWYMMSMGNEVDLHTPHWHGNTVISGGMRTDVVSLLPAAMAVGDMVPDNPGIWLLHCHVSDHYEAGMITRYEVVP